MTLPADLRTALRPVTFVVGHYGVGKTNFAVNLACDLAAEGNDVTVIDLDIVNPYFRASGQRKLLEGKGIRLVAPVFAEAGSSLDVPSLTGKIAPAIESAGEGRYVIVDVGGDDAGSVAARRFSNVAKAKDACMLGVLNRFRNLVQDAGDALANLREIEVASGLEATALVDNSHLKSVTDSSTVQLGLAHAREVASLANLPLAAVTVPAHLAEMARSSIESFVDASMLYPIKMYVRTPWE